MRNVPELAAIYTLKITLIAHRLTYISTDTHTLVNVQLCAR